MLGKKLGNGLEKWMGEDNDVYGRKGRGGREEYVRSICCSKHGYHPFFAPVLPISDVGL